MLRCEREKINKYKNKITITTDDIKKIVFLLEDPKELSKLMAYNMTVKIPDCYLCINYLDNKKCTAFPEGIPEDILTGKFNHIKKHPEQKNNILFEPIKE